MLQEQELSVNHDAGGSNVVPLRPVADHKQQVRGGVVKADLDDGYLRLSNTLVDAICRVSLSGRQFRVMHAIIKKTYGFNKKIDWIVADQICELMGYEGDATHIRGDIRELKKRKLIIKDGRKIGPNPIVSDWVLNAENSKITKKTPDRNTFISRQKTVCIQTENGLNTDKKRSTQKKDNITKDTIQKISSSNIAVAMTDKPLKLDAAVQTPNGKLWGTQDDLTCAEYIFNKVLIVNPTAKQPNWPDWANQVRLMRVQDQRTHHEICKLFKFANTDSFWASNVLCPKTLRKQWDKLNAKLLARTSHETTANDFAAHNQRYENPTARVFRELREMAEQLEQSTDHHGGGHTIDADYEPVQS
ncbi:MAG: replication protein [Thiopseudomonas sp.]|nr:replication protein [Thiopseudomonas sp.]